MQRLMWQTSLWCHQRLFYTLSTELFHTEDRVKLPVRRIVRLWRSRLTATTTLSSIQWRHTTTIVVTRFHSIVISTMNSWTNKPIHPRRGFVRGLLLAPHWSPDDRINSLSIGLSTERRHVCTRDASRRIVNVSVSARCISWLLFSFFCFRLCC